MWRDGLHDDHDILPEQREKVDDAAVVNSCATQNAASRISCSAREMRDH